MDSQILKHSARVFLAEYRRTKQDHLLNNAIRYTQMALMIRNEPVQVYYEVRRWR